MEIKAVAVENEDGTREPVGDIVVTFSPAEFRAVSLALSFNSDENDDADGNAYEFYKGTVQVMRELGMDNKQAVAHGYNEVEEDEAPARSSVPGVTNPDGSFINARSGLTEQTAPDGSTVGCDCEFCREVRFLNTLN